MSLYYANFVQVLQYYRLPEEEQRNHKNPMCNTFPRIGNFNNQDDILNTDDHII